jgi:hypothetical protein
LGEGSTGSTAYERVRRLVDEDAQATALLDRYGSAHEIGARSRGAFVREHAGELGGGEAAARIHDRAMGVKAGAAQFWAELNSTAGSPHARALRAEVGAAVGTAFQALPSYESLFGSQDFYEVEDCDSILGPAAYLVDLLRLIDEHVTPNSAELSFARRRPDIYALELTCENTTGLVPYLEIVNERLTGFVVEAAGSPPKADPLQLLATLPYPLALPLNVPLLQVRSLLASMGIELAEAFEAWPKANPSAAAERLGLAPAQLADVADEATTPAALARLYGLTEAELPKLQEASSFRAQTGLDQVGLQGLLEQNLSEEELQTQPPLQRSFFINQGEPLALSADGHFANATAAVLDRANRFLRLASRLGWSFEQTDWALRATAPGPAPTIAAAIPGLAGLCSLIERFSLGVLDACGLVTDLKTYGSGGGEPAQFDRIFANAPRELELGAKAGPADRETEAWLAAALSIDATSAQALATALYGTATPLKLEVPTLSALWRHATIASKLGLSIARYLTLIELAGCAKVAKPSVAQVEKIADAAAWIASSRLSVEAAAYIVNGTPGPSVEPPPEAAQVKAWLRSLAALAAPLLPRAGEKQAEAAQEKLETLVRGQVGALLGAQPEAAAAALRLADGNSGADGKGWQATLVPAARGQSVDPSAAGTLLKGAARWLVAIEALRIPADLLEALAEHPGAIGLASPQELSFDALEQLAALVETAGRYQDDGSGLIPFVEAWSAKTKNATAEAKALAGVCGWNQQQVESLLALAWPQGQSAAQLLVALDRCFQLAAKLGTDVGFIGEDGLCQLAGLEESATNWPTYTGVAAAVRAAIAAHFEGNGWATNAAAIDGGVAAGQRDALVPVAIAQLRAKEIELEGADDLYDYLLIDVSMGPAVETTPVIEATGAAQLYLQRCRLGLETAKLNDVQEEWWSWMLDYGTWKANREVFLYPENYLLPSVRRDKTDLFAAFESQLQQSQLSDDYVSEAFSAYFEGLRTLAKLTIVDSCVDVSEGEPPLETLYLLARTTSDPATYYFRTRTRELPAEGKPGAPNWGPWREIPVKIAATTATPVLAFGRLAIFWTELKRSTASQFTGASGTQTKNFEVWKASLLFSALTHEGTWLPPQTLVADQVVNRQEQGVPPPHEANYADMTAAAWQKPYVLRVPGQGFAVAKEAESRERIVILYGPASATSQAEVPKPPTEKDPDTAAFEAAESELGLRRYLITQGGKSIVLPQTNALVLNADYAPDYLLDRYEFAGFNPADGVRGAFVAQVDRLNRTLAIAPSSGGILLDNFRGDPGGGYEEAAVIQLREVSPNARALAVKNQPGWLIADNGDEAFLLSPAASSPFATIAAAVTPCRQLEKKDFVVPASGSGSEKFEIDETQAGEILAALRQAKLLAADDTVALAAVNFSAVEAALPEPWGAQHWACVENVLLGHPKVSDSYLEAVEGKEKPKLELAKLVREFRDRADRLSRLPRPATTLAATGATDAQLEAATAVVTLPTPVALGYAHQDADGSAELQSYQFGAERLTIPAIDQLSATLAGGGVTALLAPAAQQAPEHPVLPFSRFDPASTITAPAVADGGQVDFDGPNGLYFWEAFFHLPVLVATSLGAAQRYEAADRWFRFVFDPTAANEGDSSPKSYWRFVAFRTIEAESLEEMLATDNPAILAYEDDPFDPHAIAALRRSAYEKSTVMQYVENLIQWGDSLFAEYTAESVAAATQLYVYARDLLGPAPRGTPLPPRQPESFESLKSAYPQGDIPDFLIEVETMVPVPLQPPASGVAGGVFNNVPGYFGVPPNAQLAGYWDTVADRLAKIRACEDINGVSRQPDLFPPTPNPLELVKAAAAGPNGFMPGGPATAATVPPYRFPVMVDRARDATGLVTQLGDKLLAALERQDAETLATLHATLEGQLLEMVTTIKQNEIDQLGSTLASLQRSEAAATARANAYATLLGADLNPQEQANLDSSIAAVVLESAGAALSAASSIAFLWPQEGSPFAMTWGGQQLGHAFNAGASLATSGADIANFEGQRSLTMAGYTRRKEDWKRLKEEAEAEAEALADQVAAAETQIASAKQDLATHLETIAQNEREANFLTSKFTNAQLYQWMASRLSAVFFNAFQVALGLAQEAQAAYRFELGGEESFLSFSYWDAGHRGLTAGEGLALALSQMESSYLRNSGRRLEIERTVSLGMWEPLALRELKLTGKCEFSLDEQLFDYDYRGHYNRQIKSVAVSIPAVLGPYESFKATLKQTSSTIVTTASKAAVEALAGGTATPKTPGTAWPLAGEQIAISRGMDDHGVLSFDSRDERYLPFEGTGAVSKWTLTMPAATNRFDFDAITDVILTLGYTALDGGEKFAEEVEEALEGHPLDAGLYASLARSQPLQWAAFLAERSNAASQTLSFTLTPPSGAWLSEAAITTISLKLDLAGAPPSSLSFLTLQAGGKTIPLSDGGGGIATAKEAAIPAKLGFPEAWALSFDLAAIAADKQLAPLLLISAAEEFLDSAKLLDIELIVEYAETIELTKP